jgi:hypothetical protein
MSSSRASIFAKKQHQQCKHKKETVKEEEKAVISFYRVLAFLMLTLIISCILAHSHFNRGEEVHRIRKHIKRDIFHPLGKWFFEEHTG